MADLQAEIELTIELRKFFNIDLFVQGYYQIRAGVKFAPRIQSATKIEIKSEFHSSFDDSNEEIYPACIFNDWGVSKTFFIVYKNEEIELDDQFNFKLSVIVDAENITDCFNRMDMQLFVELYFIEKDYSTEKMSTMQQLCSRCYKLYFNPRLGIHIHLPILFDYFHLSAVTATIHGSLLCLIPPYVFDRPNVRRTSLFSFLFGQDLSQISTDQLNPSLLERAYRLHNNICELLLSSYESLQDFYEKIIEHLPSYKTKPIHHHQKCRQKLKILSEKLKTMDDIHTVDNLAHAHIAQCSAENIMLWCQFIQTFGLHETTAIVLGKEYHSKRVKRLSEGFFIRETSRINLLTNENDAFSDLHDIVRNSLYYSRLPHLPIECVELDGTSDTLPIIIEEVYSPIDEQQEPKIIINSKPKNDNLNLQTIQNSNKDEQQTKSSTISKKSNNINSSLIVRPSIKQHFSFQNRASNDKNSVVALPNEPRVKLLLYRSVDQNKTTSPSSPSFVFESNRNFSRLTKQGSVQSLPNVSFQRSLSMSSSNLDLDSSIIPNLLCSTSDKTQDDQVLLTNNKDNVVDASTFGDSSMKSKVLRESYRNKANTMDRRTAKTTSLNCLTNSSLDSNRKHSLNDQPKYFITTTDDQTIKTDRPVNYSLDSILNLTLELEQKSTHNIQRRHTIATNEIDPLLLNGFTDEENQIHRIEKLNENHSTTTDNNNQNNQKLNTQETKQESPAELDRIQNNSSINSHTIQFVVYKEKMKELISAKHPFNIMFYSDFSIPISPIPYFFQETIPFDSNGIHLIICVHGLDGNSGDLRLVKTYLELCLPTCQLNFLMSSSNHSTTFDDIDIMVKNLIEEIDTHIKRNDLKPKRISFVGHSLGNLIIRGAVSHSHFQQYRPLLYTYLSLSGPHLGTLFNTSGLVNMGMWFMQKWKKSDCLSQMSFKDHINLKETYLYKLSTKPCLEFFKNILLVASPQDRYVPFHSARIEICKAALKDAVYGSIYVQMINNLLEPIRRNPSITFVRYSASHNIPAGTNNIIGRAAHIAILDSELFVEKLILVSAAKYFK